MLLHAERQVEYTMQNLIVMFVTALCNLFLDEKLAEEYIF